MSIKKVNREVELYHFEVLFKRGVKKGMPVAFSVTEGAAANLSSTWYTASSTAEDIRAKYGERIIFLADSVGDFEIGV